MTFATMLDEVLVLRSENKRLRAAFIDASQLLTLEQLQQLSKQSALILKDMDFIGK